MADVLKRLQDLVVENNAKGDQLIAGFRSQELTIADLRKLIEDQADDTQELAAFKAALSPLADELEAQVGDFRGVLERTPPVTPAPEEPEG